MESIIIKYNQIYIYIYRFVKAYCKALGVRPQDLSLLAHAPVFAPSGGAKTLALRGEIHCRRALRKCQGESKDLPKLICQALDAAFMENGPRFTMLYILITYNGRKLSNIM